jgi:hypothetical protein
MALPGGWLAPLTVLDAFLLAAAGLPPGAVSIVPAGREVSAVSLVTPRPADGRQAAMVFQTKFV